MKAVLFVLGIFVVFPCAYSLAQTPNSLVAARVELEGSPGDYPLPVHAMLQDRAGRDYLLVFAAEESLGQAAWPWQALARNVLPEDCLLATELRAGAREVVSSSFPVIYDDGWRLLMRAEAAETQALGEAGMALQRLTREPLTWPRPSTALPKDGRPKKLGPDPLIARMLDSVRTTNLYSLVARLTGVEPVLAGGAPHAIVSRHSSSGAPLTNALEFAYQRFQGLGLTPFFHTWKTTSRTNRNVIADLPGTSRSNEVVLITAHLDDMPSGPLAPGADDNASGSAAVLLAAGVCSQYQFERSLRFVLFTGEEQGLLGSAAYAALVRQGGENVTAVLNLDMLGWNSSPPPTFELHTRASSNPGYPGDLAIASTFTNIVADYDLSAELAPVIRASALNASDHASFWNRGYPAILGMQDGASDFNRYYHTTNDTLDRIDLVYYTAAVRASVGTVAQLAGPIARVPSDAIEIADSSWEPEGTVGATAFVARHSAGALEGEDSLDLAVSNSPPNPKSEFLRITSTPENTALSIDSRPGASESTFIASLSVSGSPGVLVSCSNRIRFDFLSPPAPDRIYLARVQLEEEFTPNTSGFLCVTNLRDVAEHGGYIQLPGLLSAPANARYGTCEVVARFLDTTSTACPLRLVSASESNVVLATHAQVGVRIIDEVQFSLTPNGTNWSSLGSFTNDIAPEAATFDFPTRELFRGVELPTGPSMRRFFRLKRSWLAP